jgi:protein-L-isoaspartate(D-aspartate) O-methyltransferase
MNAPGHHRTGHAAARQHLVALMTELLELTTLDRVLEIGSGSAYQTAVLAQLVATVYTIEILEPLAARTREILDHLGYQNIHSRFADASHGWPDAAPFDAIIVTCAPPFKCPLRSSNNSDPTAASSPPSACSPNKNPSSSTKPPPTWSSPSASSS